MARGLILELLKDQILRASARRQKPIYKFSIGHRQQKRRSHFNMACRLEANRITNDSHLQKLEVQM